jgi:hypothetical protein
MAPFVFAALFFFHFKHTPSVLPSVRHQAASPKPFADVVLAFTLQ